MDKISKPRGLIRYDSLNGITKKMKFRFTSRMISYSIVLIVLLGVLTFLLATRNDFSINVLRTPGLLFQEQPNGVVSNLYDFNIVNKTFNPAEIDLRLEGIKGEIKLIGNKIVLQPQGIADAKFLIFLPKEEIKKMNTPVTLGIYSNNKLLKMINTSFLGPVDKVN
jgi:polyferredoxin